MPQKRDRQRVAEDVEFDTSITRLGVMERDGWTCHLCGEEIEDIPWDDADYGRYGTVDHVVSLEDGGTHIWDNVAAAHFDCNSGRWYESRRELKPPTDDSA